MTEDTTIGLDLAKHVFQVHGADSEGRPVLRKRLGRAKAPTVLRGFAALSGRHGGLCQRASLGAGVAGTGL